MAHGDPGWVSFECTDCGSEVSRLAVLPGAAGPRCFTCEMITTAFPADEQPYIRSLLNVPVLQRH